MFHGDDYRTKIEKRLYLEGTEEKARGRLIVGTYCAFTPKEIIAAAGAVPVSLCAGAQQPISKAEAHLPRNLCPLIKSSYGFALTDTCPYFHETDMILADTTCDGKKKMFELLGRLRPITVLALPQTLDEQGEHYWLSEMIRVKSLLEAKTGQMVTDEKLAGQIALYNRLRRTVENVYALNRGPEPLVFGQEIFNITFMNSFEWNLEERIAEMEAAIADIQTRGQDESFQQQVAGRPRILLTGCPTTNKKMLDVLERSGAIVVAMENCGGLKPLRPLVKETGPPLEALARKYLRTACPCLTPNDRRLDLLTEIVRDYRIEGIVDLTWANCQLYDIESFLVREKAQREWKKPFLQIGTDYSEHDLGQIRVRVESFLEVIRAPV